MSNTNTNPAKFYQSFPQSWPGYTSGVLFNSTSSISGSSTAPGSVTPVVVSSSFPQIDSPLNVLDGGDPAYPCGYQKWPSVEPTKVAQVVSSSQYR